MVTLKTSPCVKWFWNCSYKLPNSYLGTWKKIKCYLLKFSLVCLEARKYVPCVSVAASLILLSISSLVLMDTVFPCLGGFSKLTPELNIISPLELILPKPWDEEYFVVWQIWVVVMALLLVFSIVWVSIANILSKLSWLSTSDCCSSLAFNFLASFTLSVLSLRSLNGYIWTANQSLNFQNSSFINGYIVFFKFCRQFSLLVWTSFIDQVVHPVAGDGIQKIGLMGSIVNLASCEFYLIIVHENLVQYPINNNPEYFR